MKRIAVIHEWLTSHAGSEKVVEQILKLYPDADLYSLVDFLPESLRYFIQHKPVTTSFIQKLPFAERHFRSYLPLMPLAVEQFDLAAYDLIISSHHAVAKGILTRPDQLHISYVHTPLRYGWELQHQYLRQAGLTRGLKSGLTRAVLHYLRLWDVASAHRVDHYLANSRYVARRIEKTYRRSAEVIYPPVDTGRFRADYAREDFYLTVSRFVPYKRVDLTIAAFNQLGLPLVIIGDGPSDKAMRQMAQPNIRFLGKQPDSVVEDYMQRCRGFIFPPEEDFGITPVEAQAAGAPVIAYAKGGQAETVIHQQTGLLFPHQTVESLVQSVKWLESCVGQFESGALKDHAEKFSIACFQSRFKGFVENAWVQFKAGE
ncbi:N/A [soil metagenome]|uniref:glycosyltransferase family 4 protein n=1 Tax=Leptolyngbya sp. BC1307 TaxID=2029589 RepID=UPI000EFC7A18|nr:glycosyltransferase family 4 protein [Leptolyngbya sp. BC1307]